jgi:hypothetical protein
VNDFDLHDDQRLRDAFVDSAPRAQLDYVRARQSVSTRANRIRRRRTAGSAFAALAVVVLGSSAWAATQRDPGAVKVESTVGTTSSPAPSTSAPSSTATASVAPATTVVVTAPTSAPVEVTTTESTIIEVVEEPTEAGDANAGDDAGGEPGATGPGTTARRPGATKPPATAPRPPTTTRNDEGGGSGRSSGEQTFSASGGSIVVRWSGDTLTLVSKTPAAGWTVLQADAGGEQVSVTFSMGNQRSRIRLEMDDGRPKLKSDD